MEITSFDFWRRRSNTGAQNWDMTINGINVGSGTVPTTGSSLGTTSVSNSVSNQTGTITVVISLSGATGSGTFRLDDFTLNGSVTSTPTDTADYCNLQNPASGTVEAGEPFNIQGRVYEDGLTNSTSGQAPGIQAWIGYSTTDATSVADFETASWTWVPATFLAETNGGANDEYQADLGSVILTPGTYYYVSRFELNSGPYTYGGYSGGGGSFWDGSTYVSGVLTVTPAILDFYNLQFPETGTITTGDTYEVYAQAYEQFVTEAAGQGNGINAWIGYSTTDATSLADFTTGSWTWVSAPFVNQFFDNDEYMVDIGSIIPTAGTYYYVSRFEYNSGDYTYGGFDTGGGNGAWDGINDISGILTVNAPPTADVVITEIMYNSSGADDEWIEICNVSGSVQDLSNYIIDVGGTTEHTFGASTTLADGACITISLGSNGDGTYNPGCNFTPDEGEDASTNSPNNLANSSDTITLFAADGVTVADVVTYSTADGADGNDASLHVIDAALDNSDTGTNWQEVPVGGSPGTNALLSPCAITEVEFVTTSSTLAEDGLFIDICASIAFPSSSVATTVEVALDGGSTATNGTDYDDGAGTPAAISFPVTLTFPAGSSSNQCITIYISNDDLLIEPSETVILNLQNPAGGTSAVLGTNTTHTLTITDNDAVGSGAIMISQYYEGTFTNKWIEVKNVSSGTIPANTFYIVVLSNADADNPSAADPSDSGSPSFNNNILISSDMAAGEVRRYRASSAVLPAYASPGETGYDGNPTFDFAPAASLFSGDDIVIISTSLDSNTWANRVDVIGDGTLWGDRRCFVRNSCVATGPSTTWDISEWVEFTDSEVENPSSGTNPYLGEHETGVTTWNGSVWSDGTPDRSRSVSIEGSYNTTSQGNLEVCSITVDNGARLTVANTTYVDVVNDVLVIDGDITTETQGTFVQRGDGAAAGTFKLRASGNADVIKTTPILNTEDNYIYWSSPVNNTTIADGLTEGKPSRRYTWNASNYEDVLTNSTGGAGSDGLDDNGDAWTLVTDATIMENGKGYISMHDLFIFPLGTPSSRYDYNFPGAYNTGDIAQTVPFNASNAFGHWNLLGNPYPSSISTASFFAANNTVVEEVVYMWSHVSPPSASNFGNEVLNFSQSDYITINTMGGSGTGANGSTPSEQIPSGQAFFIKSIAAGTVNFTNSMRNSGTNANDEFWRTANTRERLWINLSSDIGIFSQILIAYDNNATNEFDGNHIDTERYYAGNAGYLVSLDNNGEGSYVIQGKARTSLNEDETIKMAFGAFISTNETYTIEAIKKDGSFLESNPIYLKDNLLNITHDLATPYTFNSDGGYFEDRFEIVFRNNALSTDDILLETSDLVITEGETDNVTFKLTNASVTIDSILIYDLQGRMIYDLDGDSSQETYTLSNLNSQIFIAKVTLSDGTLLSKKAIKK